MSPQIYTTVPAWQPGLPGPQKKLKPSRRGFRGTDEQGERPRGSPQWRSLHMETQRVRGMFPPRVSNNNPNDLLDNIYWLLNVSRSESISS